jgi:hypothetical protein
MEVSIPKRTITLSALEIGSFVISTETDWHLNTYTAADITSMDVYDVQGMVT